MKFVDEAVIEVYAGNGGDGALSFLRSRNLPRGGPDGGNGGNGGAVNLVGDPALNTLVDFRFAPRYRAENGTNGGSREKTGANGQTLNVRVPVGTTILDEETRSTIGDVARAGEVVLVAKGGERGFGNAHFKSSTNRAPRHTKPGSAGEQRRLRLTLKVVADAGLLGMPNAGKSTLISRVSASKPKVADYPFTTLTPNLGVVRVGQDASFVMADLPGLIPGASQGIGLGFRFLKHLSRARLLLHLVDMAPVDGSDPVANAHAIEAELFAYSDVFREREIWMVATKMDLPEAAAGFAALEAAFGGRQCFAVSAVTGLGLAELTGAVMGHVEDKRGRVESDADFADAQRDVDWRLADDVLHRVYEAGTRGDRPKRGAGPEVIDERD